MQPFLEAKKKDSWKLKEFWPSNLHFISYIVKELTAFKVNLVKSKYAKSNDNTKKNMIKGLL